MAGAPFAIRSASRSGSRTLGASRRLGWGHVIRRDSGQADPAEGPSVSTQTLAAHETAPSHTCPVCNQAEEGVYDEPATHAHFCSKCHSEFTVVEGKGIL